MDSPVIKLNGKFYYDLETLADSVDIVARSQNRGAFRPDEVRDLVRQGAGKLREKLEYELGR